MPFPMHQSHSVLREKIRIQNEAAEAEADICRHCYQTDHMRRVCNEVSIVACSICYKLNVFTTWCCERKNRKEITDQVHQVLRFAGNPVPRIFIDVNILFKNIPALINTGLTRSVIDYSLARYIRGFDAFTEDDWLKTATGMKVPIRLRRVEHYIDCRIRNLEPGIHLELGMDFLMLLPFRLTFDNITLNTKANWATTHHEEINYVYNMPRGYELRKWLHKHNFKMQKRSIRKTFETKGWKQSFIPPNYGRNH